MNQRGASIVPINAQSITPTDFTITPLARASTSNQWGYSSGFNKYDFGLTLGYKIAIKNSLKLGVRANYGLQDITKNATFFTTVTGTDTNTIDKNLQFRLMLSYDFFKF